MRDASKADRGWQRAAKAAPAAAALLCALALAAGPAAAGEARPPAASRPALTVSAVQPERSTLPLRLIANGNIAAWQEASIGTEANGLRLAEVRAAVGDVVRKGQVLARFAAETVRADAAQTAASVAEAEALLADAVADAQRARELQATGALSAQRIEQYLTAERTARARLDARRAAASAQRLRVGQTRVLAPDDGVVSSRTATIGAVLPAGQELFRLIRKGRLEWRAEVPSIELGRIRPGGRAAVRLREAAPGVGEAVVAGRVRVIAPTVDPQTRNGLVYVDLERSPEARAGMFARGEFDLGSAEGMTLPQSAVLLRDGFHYVMRIGADARVVETKVQVGRRLGDRIEIASGLDPAARVVASGVGFLGDGDTVRVVDAPPPRRTAPP